MEQGNLFTIQVRDQDVYYVKVDGRNLVLIRPLCDVFELDSDWHIRTMKKDEIFGDEVCEHTTRLPHDDRNRPYTCLPEEFIYGWLSGIKFTNTMDEQTKSYLVAYKRECYHALYDYFHGKVTEADKILKEKVKLEKEVNGLKNELFTENEKYRVLVEKEAKLKSYGDPYAKLGNKRKVELTQDLFVNNVN